VRDNVACDVFLSLCVRSAYESRSSERGSTRSEKKLFLQELGLLTACFTWMGVPFGQGGGVGLGEKGITADAAHARTQDENNNMTPEG
jgi:hypothetical protein